MVKPLYNQGTRIVGLHGPAIDATVVYGMKFNASLSNPIYGNSTTVHPPAVTVNYIIYAGA